MNAYCTHFCYTYVVPSHVASLQVTQQSDTLSTVQWISPLYPNGMITNYRLIITHPDDVIPTDVTVDDTVRSYPLPNLGKCRNWAEAPWSCIRMPIIVLLKVGLKTA